MYNEHAPVFTWQQLKRFTSQNIHIFIQRPQKQCEVSFVYNKTPHARLCILDTQTHEKMRLNIVSRLKYHDNIKPDFIKTYCNTQHISTLVFASIYLTRTFTLQCLLIHTHGGPHLSTGNINLCNLQGNYSQTDYVKRRFP